MRILHISDLHLRGDSLEYVLKVLISALLKDLEQHKKESKHFDLVFITGDLVDVGGATFRTEASCFESIRSVINKIVDALSLPLGRVIFVPGNHDVVEPTRSNDIQVYNDAYRGLIESLQTTKDINDFVKGNVITSKHLVLKRLNKFHHFVGAYYPKNKTTKLSKFHNCFILEISPTVRIGVAAFNSAWSCHKEYRKSGGRNILFGTEQIKQAGQFFDQPNNETTFNIALVHHPLIDYSEDEQEEIKKMLDTYDFSILYCGHRHNQNHLFEKDDTGELLTIRASAVFKDPDETDIRFIPGYSITEFSYGNDNEIEYTISPRRYNRMQKRFVAEYLLGDMEANCFKGRLTAKTRNGAFIESLRQLKLHQQLQVRNNKGKKENTKNKVNVKVIDSYFGAVKTTFQQLLPSLKNNVLELLTQKLYPVDKMQLYREEMEMNFEIDEYDDNNFKLVETQNFVLVTEQPNTPFDIYFYLERDTTNEVDQSSLKIKTLTINGVSHIDRVVEQRTPSGDGKMEKILITCNIVLERPGKYQVKRQISSVNSLVSNGIWKVDVRTLVANLTLRVKNVHKYLVDIVEFGNNTTFIKDIREFPETGTEITENHKVLLPGDGFVLVIRKK